MSVRFDELMEKKASLETELGKINTEITEIARDEFKGWSVDLFNRYPNLNEICWCQYTPYFNDGDPCYFRSCHEDFHINSEGDPWESNYEGFTKDERKKVEKEISNFLGRFDDDDMERLFGDHCTVMITRSGVDVEEYDHS